MAQPPQTAPAPSSPVAPPHDPYAALRHRDYLLYAAGGVIANVGSQMQGVAIGWEIYQRTRDPMALGWVGLIQAAPVALLALPAGHLADRWDRRYIVSAAQAATALCSLGLAAISFGQGPVAWMYLCLFLVAVARAFHFPAGQSLMPLLVPREHFGNAVTWRTSGFQVASMLGPALGGLLIGFAHGAPLQLAPAKGAAALAATRPAFSTAAAAPVYVLGAVASLLFLLAVLSTRPRAQERSGDSDTLAALAEGVRFVWRSKVILAALTLDLFAVLLGGAAFLLPVFAEEILKVGATELGWMRSAEAVGAFSMAMIMAHRRPPRRAGPLLLLAVAGFGVATIVFGLSRWLWLSLLMLAVIGALDNISVVIRHTLVQTRTPDHMRGRVSAVNSVFISASNELGGFESGLMAKLFSPVVSVVSGGIGTLLVVSGAALLWPEIRRLRKLVD